jgi:hypothetical protein
MDSTSQWQALKVALQREAEDIFYSAGVQPMAIQPDQHEGRSVWKQLALAIL